MRAETKLETGSALHIAAAEGDVEKFKLLLQSKNVDIFLKNGAGLTALNIAELKVRENNWLNGKYKTIIELITNHLTQQLIGFLDKDDNALNTLLFRIQDTFPSIYEVVKQKMLAHKSAMSELSPLEAVMEGDAQKFLDSLYHRNNDIALFSKDEHGRTVLDILRANEVLSKSNLKLVGRLCERLHERLAMALNYNSEFETLFRRIKENFPSILPEVIAYTHYNSETLIEKAIKKKRTNCVALLLSEGISPNSADPIGRTLLMCAVKRPEIFDLLLRARANIWAKDWFGRTALYYAIDSDSLDCVVLLLDSDPKKVLDEAEKLIDLIVSGSLPIIRLFLERGMSRLSNELATQAAKLGKMELLNLALEFQPSNLDAAFLAALERGSLGIIILLLKAGANVNSGRLVSTVVQASYVNRHGIDKTIAILKLLLRSGAYLFPNKLLPGFGHIAEHQADIMRLLTGMMNSEEEEAIRLALELAPYRMGIYKLIAKNNIENLKSFLKNAKDKFSLENFLKILNSRNERGFTPLREAKETRKHECARLLEEAGPLERSFIALEITFEEAMEPASAPAPAPAKALAFKYNPILLAPPLESANLERNARVIPSAQNDNNALKVIVVDARVEKLKNLVGEINRKGIDIQKAIDDGEFNPEHICCITHDIMCDPVLAGDGYNYERGAIRAHIERQKRERISLLGPQCNDALEHDYLTPNKPLREEIIRACERLLAKPDQEKTSVGELIQLSSPIFTPRASEANSDGEKINDEALEDPELNP